MGDDNIPTEISYAPATTEGQESAVLRWIPSDYYTSLEATLAVVGVKVDQNARDFGLCMRYVKIA